MGKGIGAHLLWENDKVVGIDFGNGSAEHEFGIKPLKRSFDVDDNHITGIIPPIYMLLETVSIDGAQHECLLAMFDAYDSDIADSLPKSASALEIAKAYHIQVNPSHEIETDWDQRFFGLLCFDDNANEVRAFLQSLRPGSTKIGVGSAIFPEYKHAGLVIKQVR